MRRDGCGRPGYGDCRKCLVYRDCCVPDYSFMPTRIMRNMRIAPL